MPMAELRSVLADDLGLSAVATYIQSGNAVVSAADPSEVEAGRIAGALQARFGFAIDVVVRTDASLRAAAASQPFAAADPAHLHIGFLAGSPSAGWDAGIDRSAMAPEQHEVIGEHLYLHLPNGMGRSKLADTVTRAIGVPVTVRGWRTVATLVDML